MKISELMTRDVKTCAPADTLQRAAQIMWENDCGIVPIVEGDRVVGMITDRDVCMAAYTQGQPLWQIPVSGAMATDVHGVHEDDSLDAAESLMQRMRVRRVPVLDGGGRLKGILSMNDLARHSRRSTRYGDGLSGDSIVRILGAISEPRDAAAKRPATNGSPAAH